MKTALKISVASLLIIGAIGLSTAWAGFLVMLLCGALWHTFGILRPIGFVPALWIGLLLALLGAAVRKGA